MSWQWRMIQKLKRNWLVVLKLTWGTSQILTRVFESLKKLSFNWLLVTKVYIVRATKVHSSYLSWHWRVTQILKVSTLGLWWDPFVESRKFTKQLCVMAMKNNAKFEEELNCHFKTDMRNLTNFDSSTRKSKKIAL